MLTFLITLAPLWADEFKTLAVVKHLDEIDVPAQRDGLIAELPVRRGFRVETKQKIAQLDRTEVSLRLNVSRSELKQAQVKAENDGPVAAAQAGVSRSKTEEQLLEELGDNAVFLEKFRMKNNLEKSLADLKSAESQLLQDQIQVEVKSSQARLLENDLRLTTVESPVNGLVLELLKHQGEWVRQGEPIVKVTRMDRLLVEGFLDSKAVTPLATVGAKVRVSINLPRQSPEEFEGLVVEQSAPKLELDGKFAVWVEIENRLVRDRLGEERWLIRPGMSGSMVVKLQ